MAESRSPQAQPILPFSAPLEPLPLSSIPLQLSKEKYASSLSETIWAEVTVAQKNKERRINNRILESSFGKLSWLLEGNV